MERDFRSDGIRNAISLVKGMFPGRKGKEEKFQSRHPMPNQEVYPSEIKQPSVDYLNSLFKQFFEIGLQLGEHTDNETSNGHAYLKGQHKALGEILTIFKGKKKPTITLEYFHEKKDARYKIDCGKPEPLTKEDVVKLLKIYKEYERENECSDSFRMGACSAFRNFLIKIGQPLPANEIQTGSRKSIFGS